MATLIDLRRGLRLPPPAPRVVYELPEAGRPVPDALRPLLGPT